VGHSTPHSRHAAERQEWILLALQHAGFLSIGDIAREFGVSHMTVRRDLQHIQETGRVRTVRGGVGLSATPHVEPPVSGHGGVDGSHLGRCAATLIGESDAIAVDDGAAAYEVARALPDDFRGTVVSHSLAVLDLLASRPRPPRVVALGGELAADRSTFSGAGTVAAIATLRVRTVFLTVDAVDHRGAYVRTDADALVKRELLKVADHVVLLAGHHCFTASAPLLLGTFGPVATLVTDRSPPRPVSVALDTAGVRVLIAAPDDAGTRPVRRAPSEAEDPARGDRLEPRRPGAPASANGWHTGDGGRRRHAGIRN
jgi:DeoR family transcriptional regulator, fructose operon transcriptional repressor